MRINHTKAKLAAGQTSIGTWLTLPCPVTAGLMARTGFDWLTVELEHSPTTFETAAQCYSIIAARGVTPLARIPWNTGENIKRVLDTGAFGIIVPMVKSAAEAEAAVAAARYAPLGQRSIGGQMHASNFDTDPSTYYANANREILVVIMIEHVAAVEQVDEILAVPGIDAYFIGPNDLHNSMGLPPMFESDHKEFTQAIEHVTAVGRKRSVPSGIHVIDAAAAQRRAAEGFQFIAVASEAGFMLSKAQEITRTLQIGGDKVVAKY